MAKIGDKNMKKKKFKFKLPKGSGYFYSASNICEKTNMDLYTVAEYNSETTVDEIAEIVCEQFSKQIATKIMHNVERWKYIKVNADDVELVGDVK